MVIKKRTKKQEEEISINDKKDPDLIKESLTKSKKESRILERVPTGVEGLDNLIEGGFEKNSTNLIVASGGSGKTIFAIQFLIEGLKRKENCIYITFEEKKREFYSNMLNLGWDLDKYENEGKFHFVEYTPEKVKTMLEEGGGMIETLVLSKKIKRVAIDSITSFSLLFESDLQKRASALELYNMLRKWDCTSVLTYERDPLTDIKTTSRVLEFESDSIILLYFVRFQKERQRYIEILKMRGTNHSKKIYPFEIKEGGIIIGDEPFSGDVRDLKVS